MPDEKEQLGLDTSSLERPLGSRHRHGGGSEDGDKVLARYVQDIEKWQYIPPAEFDTTDANVALEQNTDFETVVFASYTDATSIVNIWMPTYKKSLSKIRIIYEDLSAVSSTIRLSFVTRRARIGRPTVTDSLAEASYASVGVINNTQAIEIPRAAWNGLQQLNEHDIIGLTIARHAAGQTDDYGADFRILGLIVEFA